MYILFYMVVKIDITCKISYVQFKLNLLNHCSIGNKRHDITDIVISHVIKYDLIAKSMFYFIKFIIKGMLRGLEVECPT